MFYIFKLIISSEWFLDLKKLKSLLQWFVEVHWLNKMLKFNGKDAKTLTLSFFKERFLKIWTSLTYVDDGICKVWDEDNSNSLKLLYRLYCIFLHISFSHINLQLCPYVMSPHKSYAPKKETRLEKILIS